MSDVDALVFGAIVLAAAGALAAWALMLRFRRREILHREWMAALEKGVPLADLGRLGNQIDSSRIYLLRGMIWLACGLTLTMFLVGVWLTTSQGLSLDEQIAQARELGYTQEEIDEMSKEWRERALFRAARPGFPYGLTFVGIIPAGIGIAYLVFYGVESRRATQK
jgi:hypothetical protein